MENESHGYASHMRWESNPLQERQRQRLQPVAQRGSRWVGLLLLVIVLIAWTAIRWSALAALILAVFSIPQFVWMYLRQR
jgi:hypothetical protein